MAGSNVIERYGRNVFVAADEEHTPYNKRRWEVESSRCSLEIEDCEGGGMDKSGWVRVELQETTQAKPGGPFQQRTISIELHGEDRKELIRYLGGKA